MTPFAAIFVSFVLQAAGPLQPFAGGADHAADAAAPASGASSARALALANARFEWRRAWAAAQWDRSSAPVRELGDRITREFFPLLTDSDDDLRRLAQLVLAEVSAPALGALLRAQATPDTPLVTYYLARNDDDAFAAAIQQSPAAGTPAGTTFTLPMMETWLTLGRMSRRIAGPRIVTALAHATGYDRERTCEAALWLPSAARDAAVEALLVAMRDPTDEPGPSCTTLLLTTRNGRARLFAMLQLQTASPTVASLSIATWRPFAVLGLLASERAAATRAVMDRVMPADGWSRDRPWVFQALDDQLIRYASVLPLSNPAARPALDRLTRSFQTSPFTALVRYASADIAALTSLLGGWQSLDVDTTATVIAALTLLSRTNPQIAALRSTLDRIASHRPPDRASASDARATSQWVVDDARRALDATAACGARRACLLGLAMRADDMTAARAIVLAGRSAFAGLGADDAHAFATRMLGFPTGWLAVAFYSTIPSCPRALRVLRETVIPPTGRDVRSLAASYVNAFRRRCEEAP